MGVDASWRFPGATLDLPRIEAALDHVRASHGAARVTIDAKDMPHSLRVWCAFGPPPNERHASFTLRSFEPLGLDAGYEEGHATLDALHEALEETLDEDEYDLLSRSIPRSIVELHTGGSRRFVDLLGDGPIMLTHAAPRYVSVKRAVDEATFRALEQGASLAGRRSTGARDVVFGAGPVVDLNLQQPLDLGLPPDAYVIDVWPKAKDDTFVLTTLGLYRCRAGRADQLLPKSEVQHWDGPPRGLGTIAQHPNGELWIADGALGPHVILGDRLTSITLPISNPTGIRSLSIDGTGAVWLAEHERVLRGDGKEWETVWSGDLPINALCTTSLGEGWIAVDSSPATFLHVSSGTARRVELASQLDDSELIAAAATRDPDVVWLASRSDVVRITAPDRPRCSIYANGNRDDATDEDVWMELTSIADVLADELDGWPID